MVKLGKLRKKNMVKLGDQVYYGFIINQDLIKINIILQVIVKCHDYYEGNDVSSCCVVSGL